VLAAVVDHLIVDPRGRRNGEGELDFVSRIDSQRNGPSGLAVVDERHEEILSRLEAHGVARVSDMVKARIRGREGDDRRVVVGLAVAIPIDGTKRFSRLIVAADVGIRVLLAWVEDHEDPRALDGLARGLVEDMAGHPRRGGSVHVVVNAQHARRIARSDDEVAVVHQRTARLVSTVFRVVFRGALVSVREGSGEGPREDGDDRLSLG